MDDTQNDVISCLLWDDSQFRVWVICRKLLKFCAFRVEFPHEYLIFFKAVVVYAGRLHSFEYCLILRVASPFFSFAMKNLFRYEIFS